MPVARNIAINNNSLSTEDRKISLQLNEINVIPHRDMH